jgi:exodeoxyribonuclease V beta subunit
MPPTPAPQVATPSTLKQVAAAAPPTELDLLDCPLSGMPLIEASAGTGKTWNICGLYLRLLIERGLRVQQILVVTFTNAATAELRERVRGRIAATLAHVTGQAPADDDSFIAPWVQRLRQQHGLTTEALRGPLEAALHSFDEAAIFTIHGFCQRALADAPFSAGLPLQMDLVQDDSDALQEAVNDFWRRHLTGPDGAGVQVADPLAPELLAHLRAQGDQPERWARLLQRHLAKPLAASLWPAEVLAPPAVDSTAASFAFATARRTWQADRADILARLQQAWATALNRARYREGAIDSAAAEWDRLFAQVDPLAAFEGFDGDKPKAPLLASDKLLEGTKKNFNPPQHPFFDQAQTLLDARQACQRALDLARLHWLRRMLQECAAAVRAGKQARRVWSFDDLLFQLHQRLTAPEALPLSAPLPAPLPATVPPPLPAASPGAGRSLAATLRARFPAALIDEFQDTDPLQFGIFEAIYTPDADGGSDSSNGNGNGCDSAGPLCLVGDPKQAIYSFRQADLPTYLRAQQQASARYSLAQNQRSTAGLIHALNALFTTQPHAFMQPGLAYRAVGFGRKPRPVFEDHRGGGAARGDLHLWALPEAAPAADGPAGGGWLERPQALQAAVRATAAEIAELLNAAQHGQVRLDGAPLRAGDIAVLVRTHTQGGRVRQALAALGLGSVELSQASVFQSREAQDIERLLCAVLEPGRSGLLRAALATALLGWDAAALGALADASLSAWMQQFSAWRDTWQQHGVGTLLRQVLAGEQVSQRLLPLPDGERRLTNLLHLVECLHQAAQTHPAADTLLHWLQTQLREADADESTQLRLESDQNLVQIVTLHKAKGLEYPIVFCPFLFDGHPLRGGAGMDGLDYHASEDTGQVGELPWIERGGAGVATLQPGDAVIDYRGGLTDDGEAQQIKSGLQLEAAAENLRLAYVALTRAVVRCYVVVGCYRNRAGKSWSTVQSTRSLLNWLVAANGMAPEAWFQNRLDPARIDAAWRALAVRAEDGAVDLTPLPMQAGQPVASQRPPPEALAALPPPARVAPGWRLSSYSGLAFGAVHEAAASDHDERLAAPDGAMDGAMDGAVAAAVQAALPASLLAAPGALADDILLFPRGAAAGECIHTVFERIAFDDPAGWPGAIAAALADHPLAAAERAGPAVTRTSYSPSPATATATAEPGATPWARMLHRMLRDVTHTALMPALRPGLRLASIGAARRRTELEFHLPARGLTAGGLNDALQAWGYAAPRLGFGRLEGYLRGFIDLCFEHEGRYYLLDWKSNHLGTRPVDYAAPSLARAMAEHAYHLQALLYTVALHRLLALRLPGYRYEAHFGGVFYLFVRGVRPGCLAEDGTPLGVVAHRPAEDTVQALSDLLEGSRA